MSPPAPSPVERRPAEVRGMFDAVAPRYDCLNRLLSMGTDALWRRRTVRELALAPGSKLLDLCAGTGDLGLAFARAGARVTAADFSLPMLARARSKGLPRCAGADALALPFRDGAFDACAAAFGFRNTADWSRAAAEMARILRPGGRVGILDFGMPEGILSGPYRLYLKHVLPRLAGFLSRREAYEYLQESVAHFHAEGDVEGRLRAAGFREVRRLPLTGGIAVLWTGVRA